MRRMRWLRILLPLLFLGFLITIVLTVRPRPRGTVTTATPGNDGGEARMEGFRFTDLVGGRRRLYVEAGVGRIDDDGAFTLEDVRRAEIDREGKPPLVLRAPRGTGAGKEGQRVMRLEGGVTLTDEAAGLMLTIPAVEVDQINGVVRSLGEVSLAGGTARGTASAVIHSLTGKPDQIMNLVLDDGSDGHLEAQKATLEEREGRVVLEGAVVARQAGIEVTSDRVVLTRSATTGRLERVEAGPGVAGSATKSEKVSGKFRSREAVAIWADDGTPKSLVLAGDTRIEQTGGSVTADRVAIDFVPGGQRKLAASGAVAVNGTMKKGPGHLTCDALAGTLSAAGDVEDGTATGNVRFSGDGTSGEAAEARFTALGPEGSITLQSGPTQRARAANGRTRVAADTIASDLKGRRFEAKGRVESTLLPDPARKTAAAPMFAGGDAIHFVSSSLTSDASGGVLVFRGDVRGWQGERSLAASTVEMRQEGEALDAEGGVTTRTPRATGTALREGDYVQVTGDRLAYRGQAKHASYDGNVRVRLAEGWLEAPHLEATFGDAGAGSGLQTATATGNVKFEFRARGSSGGMTTATGHGDRAIFEAAGRAIRLFGEEGAATIVATGEKAGSTAGRVLRYELETGALEVESGDRDRATIKTPTE